MRILIATPLYPPEIGGPATYTKVLETELHKHGIEVSVAKFGDVRNLPPIIRHFAYFFKVHDAANDADIIYAQDPLAVGLPALFAARLLQKRFIVKIVGDRAWEEEQRQNPSITDPLEFQTRRFGLATEIRRKIERFVAQKAEQVIVPSEYLKKVVLYWGVSPERIRVIQNGISKFPSLSREEARTALHLDSTPIVVSIGRLSPWKGFSALIRSATHLRARGSNARILIIGGGTEKEREELEKEIQKHDIGGIVSLIGSVSREDVLRYLVACDVFVLNTAYEGFSHQILEAMAAGAPIVTTSAGGNAELLHHGEDCLIVPYNDEKAIADALITLLKDEAMAKRLGEAARHEAVQYTEERMVENLLHTFRRQV